MFLPRHPARDRAVIFMSARRPRRVKVHLIHFGVCALYSKFKCWESRTTGSTSAQKIKGAAPAGATPLFPTGEADACRETVLARAGCSLPRSDGFTSAR